jgi:glucokinase
VGGNPVFWINMGSGIGGGLVVDGSLYHGAIPGEAEIGHLRLDKNGTILEHRCSGWAVDAPHSRGRDCALPEGTLGRLVTAAALKRGEARLLAQAVERAGDPEARCEFLARWATIWPLRCRMRSICSIPSVIVMGGGSVAGGRARCAAAVGVRPAALS